MEKNRKSILLFVGVTFGVTWLVILAAFFMGIRNDSPYWSALLTICMFVPALASLLVRKITGEGMANIRIKPRFRGNIRSYVMALLLPTFCIICGCAAYFMVFPTHMDPGNAGMVEQLMKTASEQGIELSQEAARGTFYTNLLVAVLIAPLVNILVVFGEELGWRGFLLQKLANVYGPVRAVLFSGLIWGFWHAPMIIMGHNYGFGYPGYPFVGILMMVLFCVSVGSIMSYLTFRTGSVIPACLIHSTINAIAGIGIYFISPKADVSASQILLVGPTATGILGMSVLILVGALYLLKSRRITWNSETEASERGKELRLFTKK